nr:uncharacterized protein C45G9.4-like [Aegilops tauschii subsp. strangulata]
MTTDELVTIQTEFKGLNDEFNVYRTDSLGAKVKFVKLAEKFTSTDAASLQHESPQASDDIARATTSVAPEEQARPTEASAAVPEETEPVRPTAPVVPEESESISSAPPAPTPSPILPSALDVKKTKAAERATVKKRKASASSDSSAPKKMKTLTSSFQIPIDAIPVSSMPSKELVPFGDDYEIPSESDEDVPSAASSEQLDEEIKADNIPSTPVTEEVQMGSDEPQATPLSNPEDIPATNADVNVAEEMKTQAATEAETEIPQPVVPEIVIPETVKALTDTPQPKSKNPFSKKQKFKEGDATFDQEDPEPEKVDEEELATDEEEEQPQQEAYTTYPDLYGLQGSINDMSNLAESLRDSSAYMSTRFSN